MKKVKAPLTIEELEATRKSAGLAAGLNLVLPGAGYIYCGRIFLGIIVFPFVVGMFFAMPMAGMGLSLVMIIDGFLAAGRFNQALDKKINGSMRKCPHCAELVRPDATTCKHCHKDIGPQAQAPANNAGLAVA